MRVILQAEIDRMNGQKKIESKIETDFDDPVFLNMQFCMEREEYEELAKLCVEYKADSIQNALQSLLIDCDPYKIIEKFM